MLICTIKRECILVFSFILFWNKEIKQQFQEYLLNAQENITTQLKEINKVDKTNISISQDLSEIDRIRNKKLVDEKKN